MLNTCESGCCLEYVPAQQHWFVGLFKRMCIFLLLIFTINSTIVQIKMVLFCKTSGINSWLSYLLSCQGHVILVLQIRIMLSSSTVLSVFSIWSVGKQCASATWGRNIVNKRVFWGLAAGCYQLRTINQLRQFTEYTTKILDSKREMWAQGEPIKKRWISQKVAVVSSMCSKSFQAECLP